jgi:hypothetical protein
MKNDYKSNVLKAKNKYTKPTLIKLGSIKNITLKTGSLSDFGGNKYRP